MLDAMRGYIQLVTGLTDVTRQKATAAAKTLVSNANAEYILASPVTQVAVQQAVQQAVRGQAAVTQVAALTDEIVATGRANRELLVALVRTEAERAVGRVGVVQREQWEALERRVARLEGQTSQPRTTKKSTAKRTAKKTAKKTTRKTATPKTGTG